MLKEKMDSYFSKELSKEELGQWAEYAYYDLLRGGYVKNEKIVIYPFLKVIAQIDVKDNDVRDEYPCSEKEIKNIYDILQGKRKFYFQIELAIPMKLYSFFGENTYFDRKRLELFSEMQDQLKKYKEGVHISPMLKHYINIFLNKNQKGKNDTVLDLLENSIIKMLKALFEEEPNNMVVRKRKLRLYAQEAVENGMLERLMDYVDCFTGIKNFNLLVSYENGVPEMMLLV